MGLPCTLIYKRPVWIWNSTLHPTVDIHTFRACRGFRGRLEQLIHISRISGWITYLIAVSPDYHITLDVSATVMTRKSVSQVKRLSKN